MSRPAKLRPEDIKAVLGSAGVLQAIHIWTKRLHLHEAKFEHTKSLDEKEISIRTWDGCTKEAYDASPEFYKRLNTMVIEELRNSDTYKGTKYRKIERIYGSVIPGQAKVSKICRSNKRQAAQKQRTVIAIATGCIASAVSLNERHDLGTNIGQAIFLGVGERMKALNMVGLTQERKDEIQKQIFIEQAMEAGKAYGKADVAASVLSVLDNSPPLIAMDDKVQDEFAKDANKRRKTKSKK